MWRGGSREGPVGVRGPKAEQQEAEVRGRASGHHQPAREHLLGVAILGGWLKGRGRGGREKEEEKKVGNIIKGEGGKVERQKKRWEIRVREEEKKGEGGGKKGRREEKK